MTCQRRSGRRSSSRERFEPLDERHRLERVAQLEEVEGDVVQRGGLLVPVAGLFGEGQALAADRQAIGRVPGDRDAPVRKVQGVRERVGVADASRHRDRVRGHRLTLRDRGVAAEVHLRREPRRAAGA